MGGLSQLPQGEKQGTPRYNRLALIWETWNVGWMHRDRGNLSLTGKGLMMESISLGAIRRGAGLHVKGPQGNVFSWEPYLVSGLVAGRHKTDGDQHDAGFSQPSWGVPPWSGCTAACSTIGAAVLMARRCRLLCRGKVESGTLEKLWRVKNQ